MTRLLAMSHAGVLDVNRAIFQNLARVADVDVTLVVPKSWKGDLITDLKYESSPNDAQVRVIPLPAIYSGNGSLFFYASTLRTIDKQIQPDFVFVDEEPWSLAAQQAFRAFKDRPKCFFTKQNLKKTIPLPFRMAERWVFEHSSFAYVVADEVGDVLRWKGYGKDIRYLPHSYDPDIFKPLDPSEHAVVRDRLGIPTDATVIGYFGRLTEEKGVDDLAQAMQGILSDKRCAHAHFLWVGNGPLYDKFKELFSKMPAGRVSLIPAIPHHEVGTALAATDILVLPSRTTPSWKEQFGRILVEAMACGAAVVGSDSGEIPHLIQRTGGGLSFREGDVSELKNTLTSLILDPGRVDEFKRTGRQYVQENLTHAAVARYLAQSIGLKLR